ncbi:MAG: radical SAM protein, partial [Patescibacteria group bacterium]|nr:radical SAM protein [Patescibacteria group bacterium]
MTELHYKTAQHSYLFEWPDAIVVVSGLTGYIGAYPTGTSSQLNAVYRDPSQITPAFRERFPELFEQLVFLPVNVDERRVVAEILRKSRCKHKKPAFVLQLTELCNLYCKYCYQEKHPKFMSAAMAERAIAYILGHADAADHLTVTYFGGEPLLAFERIRQIHTAVLSARPSARFTIITNGTLFDDAMASFFQSTKKLGSVQLTIDGDRVHHDALRCHRNGTGSYDEIRRALPALARSCENLSVRVNVTADNRDSIPNLLCDLDAISTHRGLENIHVYLARATP